MAKKKQKQYQSAEQWMSSQSSGSTQSSGGMQTAEQWMEANAGAEMTRKSQTSFRANQLYKQLQDAAAVRARRQLAGQLGGITNQALRNVSAEINRGWQAGRQLAGQLGGITNQALRNVSAEINRGWQARKQMAGQLGGITNQVLRNVSEEINRGRQAGSTEQVNQAVNDYRNQQAAYEAAGKNRRELLREQENLKKQNAYLRPDDPIRTQNDIRLEEIAAGLEETAEAAQKPKRPYLDPKDFANQAYAAEYGASSALRGDAAKLLDQSKKEQQYWEDAQKRYQPDSREYAKAKERWEKFTRQYQTLAGNGAVAALRTDAAQMLDRSEKEQQYWEDAQKRYRPDSREYAEAKDRWENFVGQYQALGAQLPGGVPDITVTESSIARELEQAQAAYTAAQDALAAAEEDYYNVPDGDFDGVQARYLEAEQNLEAAKTRLENAKQQAKEPKKIRYTGGTAAQTDSPEIQQKRDDVQQLWNEWNDINNRLTGAYRTNTSRDELAALEAEKKEARQTYESAKAELEIMERDARLADQEAEKAKYETDRYREDFERVSQSAMENSLDEPSPAEPVGYYIANQEQLDMESAAQRSGRDRLAFLADGEIQEYYYRIGKYGLADAREYLNTLTVTLDKRKTDYYNGNREILYGTSGALVKTGMNAASVLLNVIGGISSAVADVGSAIKGEFNPYAPGHEMADYASTVRGVTARDITENVRDPFWQTVWQNTYQAGMSALDSALGAAMFGNGYTAIMGASSASQRARELYEDGASGTQIALGAVASGAIEMATEKYSIEYFTSHFLKGDIKGFADWMKKTLVQGVNEMSEEMASELANQAVDAVLRGANSDNSKEVRELMAQGIPEEEAKRQALVNRAVDVFWAGYGGFVSGAAMGGVGGAVNRGMQNAQYRADGAQIIRNEGIQALTEQAQGLDVNQKLLAIANDRAGRTLTELQRENLIQRGRTQRALGQLYAQVTSAQAQELESRARADVQQAAEQALDGQTEDPKAAAAAATKAAFGESLTAQEQQAVEAAGGEDFVARLQDTARSAESNLLRTVGLAAEEGSSLNPKTLAQQRSTVQEAAQEYSDPAAMVSVYRDGQDPALFIRGWKAAYANGRNGVAVKYSLDSRLTSRTGMTRGQIIAAHEAGRKAAGYGTEIRTAENTAAEGGVWQGQQWNDMRNPGGQNGTVAEGAGKANAAGQEAGGSADGAAAGGKVSARSLGIGNGTAEENLTVRQAAQYTAAEKEAAAVAAEHGLDITIVTGGSIKTVEQVDGKDVLTRSRALIVGDRMIVRSDDPLFSPAQIARHEAAHRQIDSGEISLGTAVRQLREQYSTAQIKEMIRLYTAAYGNCGMNARQVLEEMVCDAMGRMNAFATEETSSVAGEVGQFLRQLRKGAQETQTQTEGQKKNATEGVKHSREMAGYDYTKSFEQQLEDWKDGKIPKNDTLLVGATPEVFKGIGMPALPVTINGTHIDYALNNSKDFDHFLGADLLKQLPEAIKKPVAIMTSGTKSNSSVVAMLEVRHNGKQVIVPVAVGGFGFQNGIQIDSNAITSAYGKNNSISKVLHDAIEQESNGSFRLYYLDEEKATALFQVARVPMPKMPGTHDGGFIHSLTDTASPVKLKISSVTQSQQFKRWFGDWQNDPANASKVVNADGTPKVMYHGTNAEFTVFDRSKGKKKIHLNVFGDGNYFTALEQGASRYGSNVVAAYLDIKNPYVKADGFNTVADQIASEFGIARDSFTGKDVSSILRRRGYDGVVMYDGNGEIVIANAFGSNQIKSATDNIGTFDGKNPDIRYSREMEERTQQEITQRYQQEVDQVLNAPYTTARQLIVGYTPTVYQQLGMPSLPLTIGSGHVYSAAKTETEARQNGNYKRGVHYHGLGDAAVKNIYNAIQDPVMIISAKDVNRNVSPLRSTHSVVAIVDIGTAKKSLLVPIEITAERKVNGARMDVNTISSVYEKSVKSLVTEAIAQENAGDIGIFYAKKEAMTLPGAGVQFPAQLQQSIASDGIVHRFSEKVNMKISENVQSQQFKRWFGDWQNDPAHASKVVNADGTPKVVYHQTDADFTIFDPRHEGAGTRDSDTPFGIFLKSSDKNIGLKGSKQMPLYADIKNPLTVRNREQLIHEMQKISDGYATALAEHQALDVQYKQETDNAIRELREYMVQWRRDNPDASRTALYDDSRFNQLFDAEDNLTDEWESKAREIELRSKEAITKDLEAAGYDGVIIQQDVGSFGRSTDAYIALHPEQVKSATDNIGTFDGKNPDIRYSREMTTDGRIAAVVDEDILSGIDLSQWNDDTKKKVKAAAKEALTKFNDGIAVLGITRKVNRISRKEFIGSKYSEKIANTMPALFADKMRAAGAIDDVVIAATDWARDGKLVHPRTDNFVDFDHGKVLIEAGKNQYSAEVVVGITKTGDSVFYDVVDIQPAQFTIKKVEPSPNVTTNKSPDAAYESSTGGSITGQGENVKQKYSREMETVAALKRQNELLRQQRDYWKEQTRTTDEKTRGADKGEVRSLASQLIRQYSSKTEVDEILPEVQWLADSIWRNDPKISYADLQDSAQSIARMVLDGSEVNLNAENWETGQALKRFLRGRYINVNEGLKEDIGDFQDFKRRNRSMHFRENGTGTGVDSLWLELQNDFGKGLFPDSVTHPGDQIRHIADTLSSLTESDLQNPYAADMELTAEQMAYDVIARAAGVNRQKATKADKAVERATQELNQLLKAGRNRERVRIEQSQQTTYRQQIKAISEKFQRMTLRPGKGATQHAPANLAGAVKGFCELFNDSEMRRAARWQQTLEERSAALAALAARESVPKSAAEEARKIGTAQARLDRMTARLANLQQAYRSLSKGDYENAYDETVSGMIDSMAAALRGKDIYQLDAGNLLKVKNTMTALLHTVSNANKAFSMGKDKTVSGMAQKMAAEMRQVNHQMPGLKSMAGRYWMWQMTPDTFFNYMCGYIKNNEGQVIQKAFQRGSEKMFGVQREFYQMFQEYTEGSKETRKELRRLMNDPGKNMVSWGLKDRGGNEVQTSRGMMMQAYMLLRQQDSFESLQFGGFSLPNAEEYYKGNVRGAYGNMEETAMMSEAIGGSYADILHEQEGIRAQITVLQEQMETLSPADAQTLQEQIDALERQQRENRKQLEDMASAAAEKLGKLRQAIEEQLTPLEKQLIEKATQWYAHTGKLMKDVFLEMYGYAPTLVDNYVPIHRDPATIKTDIRDMAGAEKAFNLENSSFTIDRVRNYQPIMLTDFFQELEGQKEKMSRYVGFAQVQKDFGKLWKTRIGSSGMTINKLVEAKFGSGRTKFGVSGTDYVEHYIADIAGGHSSEDILGDFYGHYAAATLRLNPRVAVSQAASIPTAASVVGWKSAAAGFAKGLPNAMSGKYRNELAARNVWFWQRYRGQGGSTELADIKQKGGVIEKAANSNVGKKLFNWCQTVDVFSTGSFMWCMAEDYVQRNQGLKPGMDGYEDAVNETYTDIIRKSQPNYTTTERSDLLRDKRAHMKMLTMFKTQSSQNLNLLMEANGEFIRARLDYRNGTNGVTAGDVKAARAKLANAATGVFLGGTVSFVGLRTIMNFIMGAVNPYRDEETDEVTPGGVIKGMGKEVLSSLAGTIALGGQVYDLVMSVVSGDKYYGMSDSALSTITELVENSQKVIANALDADKDITPTQIWNMANSWCQALGIPAANARKLYNMLDMYIRDTRNGKLGQYTSDYTSRDQYRARVAQGVLNGETGKADDALAMLLAKSSKDTDEEMRKDIAAGMREYLRKEYMTGGVTDLEAERILEYTGTEDPAAVVARWDFMLENPEVDNVSDNLVAAYNSRGELDGTLVIEAYKYKGKHNKEEVVAYIQSLEIPAAQRRALWELIKGSWKDKDTPWG